MDIKKRYFINPTTDTGISTLALLCVPFVLLFLGHYYVAGAMFFIALCIVLWQMRSAKLRQKDIVNYIEAVTLHVDNATKDSLLNFPLPMVVMGLDGEIVWHNDNFSKLVGGENCYQKAIDKVIPDINILRIIDDKSNIRFDTEVGNKFFEVVGNIVEAGENEFSIVLYFIDRTNERTTVQTLQDTKSACCILMIDNYDELMKNTEDNRRAGLSAVMERKISEWAEENKAVLTKYEKDKFYVIMENQYLNEQIERKFDILDILHEIDEGNKIPATISMGVGINGTSIQENDKFANAAIDMALGRGGAQVVIKNEEKFTFFGGHSQELEKRTKVKPRVVAFALRELVLQTEGVYIMGHKNADADVVGSAVALAKVIRNMGVEVHIVLDRFTCQATKLLATFDNDPMYEGVFVTGSEAMNISSKKALLIVVDTHKEDFVESERLLEKMEQVVVIDHHRKAAEAIKDAALMYHEPYASSTAEMVTEIVQYMEENTSLGVLEAQALFAGIVIDTKNFTFKTGVRTFEAASFLRRIGVDTIAVKRLFQSDMEQYIKKSQIVSEAIIYNGNIAIAKYEGIVENYGVLISQAADELLSISGIAASFVMCKDGDKILISGRSLGVVNVQVILEELGGGGHMAVAGAQVEGEFDDVIVLLEQAIDKNIEKEL